MTYRTYPSIDKSAVLPAVFFALVILFLFKEAANKSKENKSKKKSLNTEKEELLKTVDALERMKEILEKAEAEEVRKDMKELKQEMAAMRFSMEQSFKAQTNILDATPPTA